VLLFEWDPNKAKENLETHGVSFDEASTAVEIPYHWLFTIHRILSKKTDSC
jgi:uncharacterized DUF497 family protein